LEGSITLVTKIYELTSKFPEEEKFVLVSQMRRCAVSVPSNIAEGAARKNDKEFIQFLYISLGSLTELETQLIISNNLGYISNENIINELEKLIKSLLAFIKYLKSLNQ
jgi:four helix bundle protein